MSCRDTCSHRHFKNGLKLLYSWAATFGEVVSSLEITPEGSGYRMRNRFAKFHNLPELMNMFQLVADIQTADMLNLLTQILRVVSSHYRNRSHTISKMLMDTLLSELIKSEAAKLMLLPTICLNSRMKLSSCPSTLD